MNRNDVWVRETGGGLRLTGEPLSDILLERELRRKHLDRYAPLEPFIPGTVDNAHPASTNLPFDCVGGTECFGEACGKRSVAGHGNQSVPALRERQPNPRERTGQDRLSRQQSEAATDESCRSGPIWQGRQCSTFGCGQRRALDGA